MQSNSALLTIKEEVVDCRLCPRLVDYRGRIARKKKKEFADWNYWGRPVPGFGDPDATLLIVGLAPAAHGGNRTGRVFTGDRSGDFLYKALYRTGFASQPISTSRDDGLKLDEVYITAAVKCAPPDNQPTLNETLNCSKYLAREIDALSELRGILCLGQFAFNATMKAMRAKYSLRRSSSRFGHGRVIILGRGAPRIFSSYHPSPRNTQTGKLTQRMLVSLLRKIRTQIIPE